MTQFTKVIASSVALVALATSASVAATPKRHKVATLRHMPRHPVRYARAPYYDGPAVYYGGYAQPMYAPAFGYYGGYAPGEEVLRATARAQTEPGVTRELAPDAVQTATGGPVGGVPGFSGGGR